MTTQQKIIKNKSGLSELAQMLGNVSQAETLFEFSTRPHVYRRTTGIHVVSDTDYDGEHPAGTYLDDIMRIHFESAEDYLATGYTSLKQYQGKTTGPSSYYGSLPIIDLDLSEDLDEFNRIQRKLIRFSFSFRLTKAPEQTSTHRFTITYTNEDGVELSGTTQPITIRGGGQ